MKIYIKFLLCSLALAVWSCRDSYESQTPNYNYHDDQYRQDPNSDGYYWQEGNQSGYSNWNTGTSVSSDGETTIISVDGEVLDLPPY